MKISTNSSLNVLRSSFIRCAPAMTVAIVILLSFGHVFAQTPDPQPPGKVSDPARPPLNPFPAEQDWSFLSRPVLHPDFFDPAKYIRLGDGPQRYISFGLEYRTEYEYYDNWMLGAGPQDHNGYVMSRVMPHFDLHAGSNFRLFSELQFDYVMGRVGGPRPGVDEDPGDFHQGFIEIGPHVSRELGSSLRLGRQEVVLGSGRLFDNNEGPNVKLSFDGIRWITQTSHLHWDVFALKPVEDNHGFFDDAPNPQQTTWGSYLTAPAPILSRGMVDLYYIGLATKDASYNRGSATELRHTVGVRAFRPPSKGLDYNWEANYQWGAFGNDSIRAWSLSTETGYTLDQVRFHPRPMLRADIYSGDRNPAGNTLGTFNSLFPRGAYFTPKAIPFLGPQNLMDLHPMMQFQLRRNITGEVSWDWYWRESVHDGVYAFGSGILMDSASSSSARHLGGQGDMEIRWSPAQHFIAAFNLAGFRPGGYFDHGVDNRPPIVANAGLTYRF
ncbi:alginate export family protein [Acidicapsa acidisoli]|uniref:alginate export family protein n=1 Tax=Acidicapsa acidisoli TaxID=1615681 RepID=UPI0021DFF74E|nr:alginate export family protein [Acidicapsa acidisoli]